MAKGGIMSEDTGGFLLLQKQIPNIYPELLHQVYGNDNILRAFNILEVKKYQSYEMYVCNSKMELYVA